MGLGKRTFVAAWVGGLAAAVMLAGAAGSQPAKPKTLGPPPLTLLQIMRASVEIPADGVWGVTSEEKLTAAQWSLAEQDATNIIASASLISSAGNGPKDKAKQAHANYQAWAKDVQVTGIKILAAAKAKDLKALGEHGDHLAEICQSCHDKYRPEIPSDGVQKFPFYPARELKK
jgi:cytochrome c5